MPPKEQIAIGVLVALLCAVGAWYVRWLVSETPKGEWLARRLGDEQAVRVLRVLFGLGVLFGILLATNVLRPIQW